MKKLTLLIVLALFIQSTATSQSCLPEGVHFKYQSQIDNFQTNYPNCTEIEGNVTIGYGDGPPTNLNGLSVLTSIGGALGILYNDSLTSLTGLDNLTSIGGDLQIESNEVLTSLAGLDNVTSIGGSLKIHSNHALTSLITLDNVTTVGGGELSIWGNTALTSLTGLHNVTSFEGDLSINSNYSLTSLTGLEGLTSVEGYLYITGNEALTSLAGLDNLTSIGDWFTICCNDALVSLTGLGNVTSIEGSLSIGWIDDDYGGYYGNNSLINLTGLDNLTSIGGSLQIVGNDSLTSLTGLDNLDSIGGSLSIISNSSLSSCDAEYICEYLSNPNGVIEIHDNAPGCNSMAKLAYDCGTTIPCLTVGAYHFYSQEDIDYFPLAFPGCDSLFVGVAISGNDITNLNGLSVLTSIGENFSISKNDTLSSLTGLDNLTSIGGNLTIYSNNALTNLTGLEGISSIGGSLSIAFNDTLTNLTGLEGISSIGGSLSIAFNDTLTSLTGLDNVTSIDGGLWIRYNNALVSLTGLDNVTSIGGGLSISYNNSLVSLEGLDNLEADSIGNLTIIYNSSLSSCEAEFICEYLSNSNGVVEIHHNAQGCNSLAKLAYDCGTTLPCLTVGNYYFYSQEDIDYFPLVFIGCDTLIGVVIISGNDITNLDGLNAVNSIGGGLLIEGNDTLSILTGLDNLTSIGVGLIIRGNDALVSIEGFENLEAASIDNLTIINNSSLSSCEAEFICEYLSNPNGEIEIHDNAPGCNSMAKLAYDCGTTIPCLTVGNYYFYSQEDIDYFPLAFSGCDTLIVGVSISGNDITNLNGLSVVTSIGGSLYFSGNDALTNLTGLDNLTSIGGNLTIYSNNALTNLTGLEGITSIGGGLKIGGAYVGNPQLTNLTGLEGLTSIGGKLWIANSGALTSLAGMDNIEAGSITNLAIFFNDSLSACEVQSICDYLSSPNGYISIHDNAPGCNSKYEVEEACITVSVDEVYHLDKLLIYPNPSSIQITIELPNAPQKNALLTIYNMNAQQMLTSKITEQKTVVDVSGLPNGLYFVKVADDSTVTVGKVVKK